jgi:hypothetical protein
MACIEASILRVKSRGSVCHVSAHVAVTQFTCTNAGMKLVSVDGKEIAGMKSEELAPLILGPSNTVVSVSTCY